MAPVERERNDRPVDSAESPPEGRRGVVTPYTLTGFGLLLALAWLFGFFLQHNFPGGSSTWWQTYLFQLPPAIIKSLLSWSVLRHMLIPVLLGCGFAWLVGAGHVRSFYGLPSRAAAFSFLLNVALSSLSPGEQRRSEASSSGSSRILTPSRRQLIGLALLFSLISLGPAVVLSIYGLFWTLEPEIVRRYQVVVALLFMTWLAVMGPAFLWFLFSKVLQLTGGPLTINRGNLEEGQSENVLWRVGGPGMLNIKQHHAVAVTGRNGRLLRVLGSGKHNLAAYEKVHTVLSLQVYEHDAEVELFTRDGIKAKMHLAITYRIAPDDALLNDTTFYINSNEQLTAETSAPAREQPYRLAALSVARIAIVDEEERVTNWQRLPFLVVSNELKREVARYRLNELFVLSPGMGTRHQDMSQNVLRKGRETLYRLGIELMDVRLGRLEADERVMEAYLELWNAVWQKRREVELAQSQATAIEELESGIGDVEVAALQTMAEALQRARDQNSLESVRPLIALRLIDAIERLAREATGLLDPAGADLMERLRALRQRLDQGGPSGPGGETGGQA